MFHQCYETRVEHTRISRSRHPVDREEIQHFREAALADQIIYKVFLADGDRRRIRMRDAGRENYHICSFKRLATSGSDHLTTANHLFDRKCVEPGFQQDLATMLPQYRRQQGKFRRRL